MGIHCCFRKHALLVLGLSLIIGCTTGGTLMNRNKTPRWVSDKDAVYSPEQYLAEVGESDSLTGAKSNAAAAIAQIFRTRVTVDSTIRTRYTEITGQGKGSLGIAGSTESDMIIGQKADESLSNLRYGESWSDSMGRVYVVAYLDRAETGNLYRRRIVDNGERIVELRNRADMQDEGLRRYAFWDAATVYAEVNQALQEQLDIISMPMARSLNHPYELGELQASRADEASSLIVRVEVVGDSDSRIATALSHWATKKGFSVSEAGNMLLSATVSLGAIELNNEYENLKWELDINLFDSAGYPAVSITKSDRKSGISVSAAESQTYDEMEMIISRDFDMEFSRYLNTFLEK